MMKSVALCMLLACSYVTSSTLDLFMPNVQPKVDDTYLCIGQKLNKSLYITGFKPNAHKEVTHHMLIYGCAEPGKSNGKPWNCGEMQTSSSNYEEGPVCAEPGNIIYAWGMDAPELKLPADVAFKVGGDSKIKYLVIQVHYKDVSTFLPPKNGKDSSGVSLTTTTVPKRKSAGVYFLGSDGTIPAHSTINMNAECVYNEPLTLHPFAFRVHAHTHGEVVAGYRVRDGEKTLIGRESPQKPQMFYPIQNKNLDIQKGDSLAATCKMVNNEDRNIDIGPTANDEMCNFYMMYYVDGPNTVEDPVCYSPGEEFENQVNRNIRKDSDKLLEYFRKMSKNINDQYADENEDPYFENQNPWQLRDRLLPLQDELYISAPEEYDIPVIPGRELPDISKPEEDDAPVKETIRYFTDKNGRKGYAKSKTSQNQWESPDGRARGQSSSYSYSSAAIQKYP